MVSAKIAFETTHVTNSRRKDGSPSSFTSKPSRLPVRLVSAENAKVSPTPPNDSDLDSEIKQIHDIIVRASLDFERGKGEDDSQVERAANQKNQISSSSFEYEYENEVVEASSANAMNAHLKDKDGEEADILRDSLDNIPIRKLRGNGLSASPPQPYLLPVRTKGITGLSPESQPSVISGVPSSSASSSPQVSVPSIRDLSEVMGAVALDGNKIVAETGTRAGIGSGAGAGIDTVGLSNREQLMRQRQQNKVIVGSTTTHRLPSHSLDKQRSPYESQVYHTHSSYSNQTSPAQQQLMQQDQIFQQQLYQQQLLQQQQKFQHQMELELQKQQHQFQQYQILQHQQQVAAFMATPPPQPSPPRPQHRLKQQSHQPSSSELQRNIGRSVVPGRMHTRQRGQMDPPSPRNRNRNVQFDKVLEKREQNLQRISMREQRQQNEEQR